jgi:FkbM family methyltransferase
MTAILAFVPAYKNNLTGTVFLTSHALGNALHARGIGWGVSTISNPEIEWVRNFALTHWYDCMPHFSHLLFIDDDMGFMPEVVLDMLAFGEPVVGAIYPKKTVNRQWAVSGIENPESRGPFLEVEGLGCGCFLIRRDAVTAMIEKMPEIIDTRRNTLDSDLFRDAGIKRFIRAFDCINDPNRGKVSEDISFGRRWRECGGKVWGATHHKIVHVGPHEYADTYADWANAKVAEHQNGLLKRIADSPILKENSVLRGKPCKHGLFIYNPNDAFIGRSLEAYGEWCEFEIDTVKSFVKTGDTVFDIGANIGTHAVAFARMVGSEGKVFAVEAQPRLAKILEANVELNSLPNVFFAQKAIGDFDGQMQISDLPPDNTTYNFGAQPLSKDVVGSGTSVEIGRIDSFAADLNPSLIKIDVEGMEPDVIRGAFGTISRCKPALYLECGEHQETAAIFRSLKEIGYVAFWSIGPYFNPLNAFKNQQNIWPANLVPSTNLLAFPVEDEDRQEVAEKAGMQLFLSPDDNWRAAIERMAEAHKVRQLQAAE